MNRTRRIANEGVLILDFLLLDDVERKSERERERERERVSFTIYIVIEFFSS